MYDEISITELDRIAEKMIQDLVTDRFFQQYWLDSSIKYLQASSIEHQSLITKSPLQSVENLISSTVKSLINDLIYLIQTSIETFLRNAEYATINSSIKSNRDSASLYSVRVQLDRIVRSTKFSLPQFGLLSRRIAHLLKIFSINISTPYLIQNCALFASSLCDLLYRFEEYCSLQKLTVNLNAFQNTIDDFYLNVVKRLNMMLLTKRHIKSNPLQSRSASVQLLIASSSFSPKIQSYTKPASRKGYLLPPDLEYARNAFQMKSFASRRSRSVPHQSTNNTKYVNSIENRWNQILNGDETLRKSVIKNNDEQSAFRIACRVTKEVVDDLMREQEEYYRK